MHPQAMWATKQVAHLAEHGHPNQDDPTWFKPRLHVGLDFGPIKCTI
jgi:hypothetical protein